MKQNKQIDEVKLKAQLNDSQQQRGVSWRKAKLEAVAEARKKGYSEKAIFIELKRAGLVNHTANRIMEDAWCYDEIEYSESETPFMDSITEIRQKETEKINKSKRKKTS